MTRDPAEDFAYFSVIAAGLRDRTLEERVAILQGLGLERRWAGIVSQWAHVVLDDVGRGDVARASHYQEACAHDRTRRTDGDDAFGAASTGEPITPELVRVPVNPVTLVGVAGLIDAPPITPEMEEAPPSVTMECEPQDFDGSSVVVGGPRTLDLAQQLAAEPATLVPGRVRKLTSRSESQTLQATRRAANWSVEQYAAFSAALSLRPGHVEEVAAEFELTAAVVETVVGVWQRRLDKEPSLRADYLVLYEASLQQRKPTS